MTTYTYNTELKFKKVPMFFGSFHPEFKDFSSPVVADYPQWSGSYQLGNQTHYFSVPNDYLPNQAFVSFMSSNDRKNYYYSKCGTTMGNVTFTNKEDKEQTHGAQFKFEDYTYYVSSPEGLVKGGNLKNVVDQYASKYTNYKSWSVKFSDLKTSLDLVSKGVMSSTTVPNKDQPVNNVKVVGPKEDSTDEETAPNTLFPDNDDDW